VARELDVLACIVGQYPVVCSMSLFERLFHKQMHVVIGAYLLINTSFDLSDLFLVLFWNCLEIINFKLLPFVTGII